MNIIADIKECLRLLSTIKKLENETLQMKFLKDNENLIQENAVLKSRLEENSKIFRDFYRRTEQVVFVEGKNLTDWVKILGMEL